MSLAKAIIEAVKDNDVDLVENLLNQHAPVNCFDEDGYSPLHWAAIYDRPEAAHALLTNGIVDCDMEAEDCDGYTPLHLAIKHDHANMTQLLITYGACVNAKTKAGRTASSLAALHRSDDVIRVLRSTSKLTKRRTSEVPKNWKLGRLLGSGAYGRVFLGHDKETESEFAVKMVETNGRLSSMGRELSALEAEIQVLKSLRHERIVQYYGMAKDVRCMQIFMEYMQGGSMFDLVMRKGGLPETEVIHYAKQMLEGISYLHENMIVHRDIKGANILLSNDLRGLKLTDFGLSKRLQRCSTMSGLKSVLGSPYWMAPEVVKASQFKGEGYGRKADIWSFGCTIYEMLTSKPPWYEMEPMTVMYNIGSGIRPPDIPDTTSEALRDFINETMKRDPKYRPSAEQLFNHPFLNPYNKLNEDINPAASDHNELGVDKSNHFLNKMQETVSFKTVLNVTLAISIAYIIFSISSKE